MSPELNLDPRRQSPYLQYRAFFIDEDRIPAQRRSACAIFGTMTAAEDGSLVLNVSLGNSF